VHVMDLKPFGRIVGDDNVSRTPTWKSAADASWHRPDAVVTPGNTTEVREVVREAARMGLKVVPAGGGTGYSGGVTTRNGGVVVDLRRIADISSVDDRLNLVRVGAGSTIASFNQQLHPRGLWWPHDPGSRAMSTVGGVISVRGIGSYHTRYGWASDMVYGLTVVLANGDILTLEPRPKGRSTGYNLLALFLSAEGTLGIIVEAVVKVWRLPDHREVRLVRFATLDQVEKYVGFLLHSGVAPESLMLESADRFVSDFQLRAGLTVARLEKAIEGANWIAIASLAGREAIARRQADEVFHLGREAGGIPVDDSDVVDAYWMRKTQDMTLERTAIPTYHVGDLGVAGLDLQTLNRSYSEVTSMFRLRRKGIRFYVSWPTGEVACSAQVFYDENSFEETVRAREWSRALAHSVAEAGGTVSSILGVGVRLVEDISVERSASEMNLMRGIKALLDPQNLMNPGKLLPS